MLFGSLVHEMEPGARAISCAGATADPRPLRSNERLAIRAVQVGAELVSGVRVERPGELSRLPANRAKPPLPRERDEVRVRERRSRELCDAAHKRPLSSMLALPPLARGLVGAGVIEPTLLPGSG